MKKAIHNFGKKALLLLSAAILAFPGGIPVKAADNEYEGNLLKNPGFEDGTSNWTFWGGGQQTNNPHTGVKGFYLNGNKAYYVKQQVTVPYTGLYKNSVYVNQGGNTSATYGIRIAGESEAIEELALPVGCTYASAHVLPTVMLNQGDVVEIYVNGNTSWTNGDDFSLTYDFSGVGVNLLNGVDLNTQSSAEIRLPWSGDYILTAEVTAEEEMVISLGDQSETIPAGTTKSVNLKAAENTVNDTLKAAVTGTGEISSVELKFDVTSVPNTPPTASNVAVTGDLYSNETIVGSYDFRDEDEGQTEGSSTYRWLVSDSEDGDYEAIEGETKDNLSLTEELDLKYIKFEVTPVDSYGKAGDPVLSPAMGPVHTNLIENAGLELAVSFWYPDGWAQVNGASIPNDNTKAYKGFRYLKIPANDADAIGYYTVTVPKNGSYTLSAWINNAAAGGTMGVRKKGSNTPLKFIELPKTSKYTLISLEDIALEGGTEVEVYVQGAKGCAEISADNFVMYYQGDSSVPEFTTLKSFSVEGQVVTKRDEDKKTITVTVPYGTDVTDLEFTAEVSEGATLSPASGSKLDFTDPVEFTITNGKTSTKWVVTVKVADETIVLESDNDTLQTGFNWAVNKMQEYIMTGKSGMINDRYGPASGPVDYLPSYWCGYAHESAFCVRDFSHQAAAATLTGLWEENYSMISVIAKNTTEARGWWSPFGFNFDGSPCTSSFYSEENFLRELPAEFEPIEKAYEAYLWSGDERYINDPVLWNYYTQVLTTFVEEHDTNNNGVAEAVGTGSILCSYNERSSRPLLESGDAMGAQYQAMLAYAGMLKARGDEDASAEWYQKAQDLKDYFNNEWSVKTGDENGNYVCALSKDGSTKYNDFCKETSWFMPMKELTEPGERTDAYLDFIAENVGSGFGDAPNSPVNIEAWTYLPDVFFPYNRPDDAWKYMQFILSVRDEPHEIAVQGTNGDYPEIPFTFVSHTINGMMGIEPNAANHHVTTVPRLPQDVGYVKANGIMVGEHKLDVYHNGLTDTTLTNVSEKDLDWEVQFYGTYANILVDGKYMKAEQKEVNGETVSYVTIPVAAGATVNAKVAEVDLADLQETVEEAEKLDQEVYTEESLEGFGTALDEAKNLLARTDLTADDQTTIDQAKEALEAAIDKLVLKPADTSVLEKSVEDAEKINRSDYTEESLEGFETALNEAKDLLARTDLTIQNQEIVDKANDTLLEAIKALKLKTGDKAGLLAEISRAESLGNLSQYTDETAKTLREALENAKTVANDADATQEQVDEATENLTAAIEGLTKKEPEPGKTPGKDDETPGSDNKTPGSDNKTSGTDKKAPRTGNKTPQVNNKNPKTGDVMANTVLYVGAILVVSAAVIVLLLKRKRRTK